MHLFEQDRLLHTFKLKIINVLTILSIKKYIIY